jgi:hypothetical protein
VRYLKANTGVDGSPSAAAMKLAQQSRLHMGKTIRDPVGLGDDR